MIKQTKNYEMIRDMLFNDKELYDRISDDYTDAENWQPDKSIWIGYYENDECLALLSASDENAIVLNIHLHIPEKNRGKDSFKIGNGLVKFIEKHCDKRFVKINVKVPVIFKDSIRFSEKLGFLKEGVDRMSYIKNGKIIDRIMFGKIIR